MKRLEISIFCCRPTMQVFWIPYFYHKWNLE